MSARVGKADVENAATVVGGGSHTAGGGCAHTMWKQIQVTQYPNLHTMSLKQVLLLKGGTSRVYSLFTICII